MSASKPHYSKPHLTFEQQVAQLKARGMQGDADEMIGRLKSINYYRLSGYFYFFRQHQGAQRHLGEQFRPGTTFANVWSIYVFDSKLRMLILRAIEKIEIAVRTQVSYYHGKKFGPFAYFNDHTAVALGPRRQEYLDEVLKCLNRCQEQFIEHFNDNYSDPQPPIWIASEVLTLGTIKRIYEGSPVDVRKDIARYFDIPYVILTSWLLTLNTARNVCAHHGRFWNRALGTAPMMPPEKTYPYFYKPVEIFTHSTGGKRTPTAFAILSICNHLLMQIDPKGGWANQVKLLLDEFPSVPRSAMGIPDRWTTSPVWADID